MSASSHPSTHSAHALLISITTLIALTALSQQSAVAQGLYGEYFNARHFGNEAPIARIDAEVGFNWGNGAPMDELPSNNFSVRWRGWVTPRYSETYTLITRSDDGVRVWVDGALVINDWTNHAPRNGYASLDLVAGEPRFIQIEYFENGGGAVMELRWESPSQALEIIPSDALIPYHPELDAQRPELSSAGVSFVRSFITEGGRATISAFRLGDLSEPLTLPLTWSGDAVERFTNLPDEITIPENHSTRDINIQSRNDDTHQGSGELTIQIDVSATPELNISGQGVNDTLVIADNDHKPEPEIYTVAGEITVEGAHEFVVTATPMSDECELDESELDGRAEEYRSPISGVYSLALPEGRYLISAEVRFGDAWFELTSGDEAKVEVELPNHHLGLDWFASEALEAHLHGDESTGDRDMMEGAMEGADADDLSEMIDAEMIDERMDESSVDEGLADEVSGELNLDDAEGLTGQGIDEMTREVASEMERLDAEGVEENNGETNGETNGEINKEEQRELLSAARSCDQSGSGAPKSLALLLVSLWLVSRRRVTPHAA